MPVPRSTPYPHVREKPRYFLLRQMNVDGEFRLPGEEVPEATEWPNLHTYLNLGWIEAVEMDPDDDLDSTPTPKPSTRARKSVKDASTAEDASTPDMPMIEGEP